MIADEGYDDSADSQSAIRRHVFGIGVATYREGWGSLPHVPRDVATIIDVLDAFGYRPARAHELGLINPPTATCVQERLLEWADAEDPEGDMVIVYHAGHGVNEAKHYLVCSQTDHSLKRMAVTALPTSRLVELLGDTGVHRLLVILDTCYAGDGAAEALALEAKNQLITAAESTAEQRRYWQSLEVLAAARCGETAVDGLFAQVFASVLRRGNR